MPIELIYGFAYLKKGAAYANHELGVLSVEKRDLIARVCDEILEEDMMIIFLWLYGRQDPGLKAI